MGTIVTIHLVCEDHGTEALERAFNWFREIEARCTRFDEHSELCQLCARRGTPVPASPILFEAVRFALSVAEDTGGAFDPTVLSGQPGVSYRDVIVDPAAHMITIKRPLTLDLGAVAKGLAVDAAARELQPFGDFAIDAGGDLYLGGRNPDGRKWSVGIRHPRIDGEVIDTFRVSDQAVCTSGDYERGKHVIDPRTGTPASSAASVTVIAGTAMLADALATAAFVLGPTEGLALLRRHGVEGLILTPSLERFETAALPRS